jgi:hypothetical protein
MTAMRDRDWDILIRRLQEGKCTPFFGAGAGYGTLPLGPELAKELAEAFEYPLKDAHDLTRVTQYMAVLAREGMFPKDEVARRLSQRGYPDFNQDGEPHRIFAEFPLPIYITTNYDDFLMEALRRKGKLPRRETCAWNDTVRRRQPSIFAPGSDFQPHHRTPVVFHLHGSLDLKESMVLTEEDYFDFLLGLSEDFPSTVPAVIQEAIAEATLIFIGYGLHDWNFRVIHRGLMKKVVRGNRRVSVTVQLPVRSSGEAAQNRDDAVETYMEEYFKAIDVAVYWGTPHEFAEELHRRWKEHVNGH